MLTGAQPGGATPRVDGDAVHWRSGTLARSTLRRRREVVERPASLLAAWVAASVDDKTGGWGELAAARPRRATLEQEQKLAEVTRAARRSSVALPQLGIT
jgi:hypothetical protein